MADLVLTPPLAGRFAIGPTSLGLPVVVQLVRVRRQWIGLCVYGIFRGRDVRLSSPWAGAEILDATDAVRLDGGDGNRPVGGSVGVVRGDRWTVLAGEEADAAWIACGPDGDIGYPGDGPREERDAE